ncbi:MAG: alpha/beta hydrolase [Cyclobacteriaceae bacterium]|nr:alpha/beta hydrolase [Cyclobacteriaceae bacterium]MCH8517727.1 alpha/beta hydrolase [Cyclobacteriaceae bacterium]
MKFNFKSTVNGGYLIILLSCAIMMKTSNQAKAQDRFEQLKYPYDMKIAELSDQVSIAYADEGSGEVIVMIHGLGSYAPAWKYQVEELKKNYRCIVVDLPGYGKSSKGKYAANMTFQANRLLELMLQLGIGEFHLMGHSMGGQIAMTMALQEPNRVKSLMLMAPAGIETFTEPQKLMFKNATKPETIAGVTDEQYRTNLALNFYEMDERAEFMYTDRLLIKKDPQFMDYAHVVAQGVYGMLNEPVFERLAEIQQPTLVIYGADDKLIPNPYLNPQLTTAEVSKIAGERIPNATVVLLEKAGHFVHFDQVKKTNEAIMNFLKP